MTALVFIAGLVGISAALSVVMTGAWLSWRKTRNSGWVDTIWTFGLGAVGWLGALVPVFAARSAPRIGLVAAMAAIWSLRLGFHIARRTTAIVDDPRYARLVRSWGADASRQMFWLLQKQAVVSIPLGMAMWLAAHNPLPAPAPQDVIAVIVFIIAVAGEAIADEQLRRFRSDHADSGAVCDHGLWRWSRHPNYFFEWLGWFAYPLLALDLTGTYPWGLVAWAAPVCMYWLLVHVSGIPPLEDHMLERRGDAFRKYQMRTNEFFPAPRGCLKEVSVSLAQTAIRLGEALPWPDTMSAAVIDRLVDRTRRKLETIPHDSDVSFARAANSLPIAINTVEANTQHYEIPSRFFELVLGPQRKYSCCLYDGAIDTLAAAEERALVVTADHAMLANGQRILELGCGWGSLSLWMARRYPQSQITSVSNSRSQREYILSQACAEGLGNASVVTADMNEFAPQSRFDRVVSVEMFEHMVNWRLLLRHIRGAVEPDGLLFLHIFSHKSASYRFLAQDGNDWIARHFFTGGIMPSRRLIRQFSDLFSLEQEWQWSGRHYERTARDWLANFDRNSEDILEVLKPVYGRNARLWQRRWRLFFMATMGLFGHADGNEWGVTHYRLRPS